MLPKADQLVASLTVGVITGILGVMVSISFAALIFTGEMSGYIGVGIGFALVSAVVLSLVNALTSSYPGMVSNPQDGPAAIMGLIASTIAGTFAAGAGEEKYITVIAALMFTVILTGIALLLLGTFKLGSLVRFIPYPVIGGFLAGTGWLLFTGGFGIVTNVPLGLEHVQTFLQPAILLQWLPALIFAILLVIVTRRVSHFLVLPGMVLLGVVVFYITLLLTGTSMERAHELGLLLGAFPEGGLWHPLLPGDLAQVDWGWVFQQLPSMIAVIVISTIALLLNASGIELAVRRDIDLNQTLKSAGLASIASGLLGGQVGFPTLSFTALGYRSGSVSRLNDVFKALFTLVVLVFGSSFLTYLPRAVLGGLIIFLGLAFLVEWLYDARSRLPRSDYLVVALILVCIASIGYIQGVVIGTIAAVILFVINYSKINAIKHEYSGCERKSSISRSPEQREFLIQKGEQILILELQGFIFFGTANMLFEHIQQEVKGTSERRFVIIDFRQVLRLDSSAVMSFVKLVQLAEAEQLTLLIAHLSSYNHKLMEKSGLIFSEHDCLMMFEDVDRALAWCEDQVLIEASLANTGEAPEFRTQIERMFPTPAFAQRFIDYLVCDHVAQGEVLAREGELSNDMYFVETGMISAQFEIAGGGVSRIRTGTAGTVLGEIGMYLGTPRTATMVADEPSTIYRMTAQGLAEMQQKDPDVAAAFHAFMARQLAERLTDTAFTLKMVMS